MERTCDSCGRAYTAQRRTSKFCSSGCRVRFGRGARKPAEVVALGRHSDGPLEGAALVELGAAERTATAAGQAALALARRIDTDRDTGAAVAALTREFRATMAEAKSGARLALSPLDELRARRLKRLA